MSEKQRIEGKVARVLTARDLVLNRGQVDGVIVGMRFAILNRKGADIKDPDSGETLGSIELPKTFVKVVSVKDHLAVARTFREFRTKGGPLWNIGALGPVLDNPPQTRVETLKTDETLVEEEISDTDSYVKIGDPAVEIVDEEFIDAKGS